MTNTARLVERFHTAVVSLPAPGGGGCHAALLGAASKGVFAGLPDSEIHVAIRAGVPSGSRQVTDTEIAAAIRRARATLQPACMATHYTPFPRPAQAPRIDYGKARSGLIAKGGGVINPDDADLWEASPIRLDWPNGLNDIIAFLEAVYDPTECVYIGPAYGKEPGYVKPAGDWVTLFNGEATRLAEVAGTEREQAECRLALKYYHFIPNPLTGQEGMTKNGKTSYRADACVASFRFLLAEFDTIPKPEQVAFFRGTGLPITALIDTGGKSIHALIRVNAHGVAEWEALVENRIFPRLAGLGVDKACKNEARLSRLPGVRRLKQDESNRWYDTGNWQRLLWLSPEGRAV